MRKFAFISRHQPTPEQLRIAEADGVELVHVGDRDAFEVCRDEFVAAGFSGAVVVHPAAALRLIGPGFAVGVFKNTNRAPLGEPPRFETTGWVVYEQP